MDLVADSVLCLASRPLGPLLISVAAGVGGSETKLLLGWDLKPPVPQIGT